MDNECERNSRVYNEIPFYMLYWLKKKQCFFSDQLMQYVFILKVQPPTHNSELAFECGHYTSQRNVFAQSIYDSFL